MSAIEASLERLRETCESAMGTIGDNVRRNKMYSREIVIAQASMAAAAWRFVLAVEPKLREAEGSMVQGAMTASVLAKMQPIPNTSDMALFGKEWVSYQMPTFELSESLLAEFLLTDPGKVATSDIAWPFPAFRVQLPSPSHVFFAPLSGDGHVRSITTVDVTIANDGEEGDQAGLERMGRAQTVQELVDAISISAPAMLRLASRLVRPGKFMRIYDSAGDSAYAAIPWGGSQSVSYVFDLGVADPPRPGTSEALLEAKMEDADRVALRACGRVMANLALYLGSLRQDEEKPIWSPSDKSTTRVGKTWRLSRRQDVAPLGHSEALS